ncbi:hypothetical protein CPB86DRAFT_778903 [Serendipita vermifera]|nr:hypothetical protein CPB86DRAFT_778903 [Serendipita vermifera]
MNRLPENGENDLGSLAGEINTKSRGHVRSKSLLNLPNELLERICLQLHSLEAVKCRQLCNRLKNLIDCSVEVQLRIDLAIDGYLLGYRSNISARDVREPHMKRRDALESLRYTACWEEPITRRGLCNYELCDGVFVETFPDNRDATAFRSIVYKELVPPNYSEKRWIHTWEHLDIPILDFSFGAHGDLQVLVELRDSNTCRRVHFRTISTNEAHPNSATPYLDILRSECSIWENCFTLAYEDMVAFTFWELKGEQRLGAGMVVDCTKASTIMSYRPLSDVAFLSRDEALLLYNGEDGHDPAIGVYSFSQQCIAYQYLFPPLLPVWALFLTRPESLFGPNCPVSVAKTFIPDPRVNIIGISFKLEEGIPLSWCNVILSMHKLRQVSSSLIERHPGKKVFNWEEWGSNVTRWLPYPQVSSTGNRSIFGSRMTLWGSPSALYSDSYQPHSLILLDFNPWPIKRGATTNLERNTHVIVVNEETIWEGGRNGIKVKSSLPFRAFAADRTPIAFSFRLDGSTVIAKSIDMYRFYSFLPFEGDQEYKHDEPKAELGEV